MPTTTQDKFATEARKRLIDLGLSQTLLSRELNVHRNSVSLAIRHPAVVPDLHRRLARRLRIEPVV